MKPSSFCLVLLPCLLVAAAVVHAERLDWPQWRGPQRSGVSQETGLLTSWPEGGPSRVWLFDQCGAGYSGPAIVQNQLYIMGARDGVEQLLCLDVETGQERWACEIGPMLENRWGDGPRGTPAVAGDHVYALGAQGDLICARTDDGRLVWRCKMQDFGGSKPNWGYCESVLVDQDRVICTPGGKQGTVVALEKETGQRIWQSQEFTDPAHYASLIVAQHHGVRQYIQLTEQSLVGLAADDGRLLWKTDWPGSTAVIPTPIFHQGHVYATSGYGAGCNLFRIEADFSVTPVYDEQAQRVMKNHHGGVIRLQDHVYGYSDGMGWVCQEWETGQLVWRERSELGKGAIAYADGMLYCLDERHGEVALIHATADGWKEQGRFQLTPQSEQRKSAGGIWTHPVIVNGRLYLRDQELLFCFDVRAEK